MLLLVLVIVVFAGVVAAVVYDQVRLARRRSIERGFRVVSAQASERLQFRQPTKDDLDFFVEMAQDPVAADANGWRGDEVDAVRERFSDRRLFAKYQGGEIVAFERGSLTRVGTATFAVSPIDPEHGRSVGIHVHPEHRRKGYGREIMAAAITLLQYEPGPIHVGTRVTNTGMQLIMRQLGYEPEPDTYGYRAPNGTTYEAYWYQCGAETHPPAGLYNS